MKNLLKKAAFVGLPAIAVFGLIGPSVDAAGLTKKCYKLEWCPT